MVNSTSSTQKKGPRSSELGTPTRTILVTTYEGNPCTVLLDGEQVQEIRLGSEEDAPGRGDVYLGRVDRFVPGLSAVFVEIGLNRTAFLPVASDEKRRWRTGESVLVSIARLSEGDKGHRLTRNVSLPGYRMVLEPAGGSIRLGARLKRELGDSREVADFRAWWSDTGERVGGLLLRSAAKDGTMSELKEECLQLEGQWREIHQSSERDKTPRRLRCFSNGLSRSLRDWASSKDTAVWVESQKDAERVQKILESFPGLEPRVLTNEQPRSLRRIFGIQKTLDSLRQRRLWLKSGASIVLEKTEAMTVIDVNSGRFSGGRKRGNLPLRVNKEAVAASAEQIRLRGIEGITVIDLIEMPDPADKRAVEEYAQSVFKKDRARVRILPISEIGLLQISRQRTGDGLGSIQALDCEACGGTGKRDRHGQTFERIWDETVAWVTNTDSRSIEVVIRVRSHLLRAMDSAGFAEALASHVDIPVRLVEWQDAPPGKLYEVRPH